MVGLAVALHRLAPPRAPEVLPVHSAFSTLFPWGGLRRGGTVAVRGSAALLLALLAAPVADGAWGAVVGMPDLGIVAAVELGVAVERLALVPRPGRDLPRVAAALLDGFDVLAVASTGVGESHARRLSARARSRGAVLLAFGPWPGAELELRCVRGAWSGLGDGHGRLRSRVVEVSAVGRGAAARPARVAVTLQCDLRGPSRGRGGDAASRA